MRPREIIRIVVTFSRNFARADSPFTTDKPDKRGAIDFLEYFFFGSSAAADADDYGTARRCRLEFPTASFVTKFINDNARPRVAVYSTNVRYTAAAFLKLSQILAINFA